MTASPSTLRTLRIGGQVDPAWSTSALPWTAVRAVATLSAPADGAPVVDPTNGAHEHPLTVANQLTVAAAAGQWCTALLKPTQAGNASLALQPSGLAWTIEISLQRGNGWQAVQAYTVALDGATDYTGTGKTITVAGLSCVDINALIPVPITVPTSSAFEDAVLEVIAGHPSAVATDLSVTGRTSTGLTVASSTGTDAALPAATGSLAGLLVAADKTKLDALAPTSLLRGASVTLAYPAQAGGSLAIAHNLSLVTSVDLVRAGRRVVADWWQTPGDPASDINIDFAAAVAPSAYTALITGLGSTTPALTARRWPALFDTATYWYDTRDLTAGAATLASRIGAGTAQLGSTAGSDTGDPQVLALDTTPYAYLPGTASNNLSIPKGGGWASTLHVTATKTDNTTATFTTTASPVLIGNTLLSAGSYKSFTVRDTNGSGTVRVTIDLTTETLGQTSWTCTTGQVVTVNRAVGTGYPTAIVDRSTLRFDGSNDQLRQPITLNTGTFNGTSGSLSVIVALRHTAGLGNFDTLWSAETGAGGGPRLFLNSSNASTLGAAVSGGGVFDQLLIPNAVPTDGSVVMVGISCANGTANAYSSALDTLSANITYTNIPTMTFASNATCGIMPDGPNPYFGEILATAVWQGKALTLAEFRTAALHLTGPYV